MPFIDVETRTGYVRYKYTICTPTLTDASSLEPNLPIILFIHTVATSQIVFHSQFADSHLRRFNLVTFDTREHGETVGESIPLTYDQFDAAEDTVRLLDAISLPPCHICGIGTGTAIALQIALSHPKRVLSLTLLSQICLDGPPEVREGFAEVFECWKTVMLNAETVDEEILREVQIGTAQYFFTNLDQVSKLALTIFGIITNHGLRKWTYENLGACKTMCKDFLDHIKSYSTSELARITCPVILVSGGNNLAYPPDYDERFREQLEEAGVAVSFIKIPDAPHFMCIDYANVINPLLYEVVVSHSSAGSWVLPALEQSHSPWHSILEAAGWKASDAGFEEDEEYVHVSLT